MESTNLAMTCKIFVWATSTPETCCGLSVVSYCDCWWIVWRRIDCWRIDRWRIDRRRIDRRALSVVSRWDWWRIDWRRIEQQRIDWWQLDWWRIYWPRIDQRRRIDCWRQPTWIRQSREVFFNNSSSSMLTYVVFFGQFFCHLPKTCCWVLSDHGLDSLHNLRSSTWSWPSNTGSTSYFSGLFVPFNYSPNENSVEVEVEVVEGLENVAGGLAVLV